MDKGITMDSLEILNINGINNSVSMNRARASHQPILPKISIVTASYNQGQFIEETIQSLLSQGYPNLEYLIHDGQSTDNTLHVIHQYEDQLTSWISEADSGAADAIEKGRLKCSGDLFNWLNSDDYLLPNTLAILGAISSQYPDYDLYAFIGLESWDYGEPQPKPKEWVNTGYNMVSCVPAFAQESTFIRSKFLEDHSILIRKEYHNCFDTALYEEMLSKGARVLFVEDFGGVIRHHALAKTTLGVPKSDTEMIKRLESELFTWRQRVWRRLTATRLSILLKFICNTNIGLRIVSFLIGKSKPIFNVCRCVNSSKSTSSFWQIIS
jgi:glycosyltransferase involved in cell wall biosynthesis